MLIITARLLRTEGVQDFFGVFIPTAAVNNAESGVNTSLNVIAVTLLPTIAIFHRSNIHAQIKEPETQIVALHR